MASAAQPTAKVSGFGNFVVQIVGDGNVAHFAPDKPSLWLTTYDAPGWRAPGSVAPSATPTPGFTATGLEEAGLLRPHTRSFALRGRDTVLAELRGWRDDPRPVSVLALTGPGGRGKTRLALELCAEAGDRQWLAGFVTHEAMQRFANQQALAAWGWNAPVLAVVDYAAGKPAELRRWLEALSLHPALNTPNHPPLRLLLLNRDADPTSAWWKEAFGQGAAGAAMRCLLAREAPLPLGPLDDPADRHALFTEAYSRASGAEPPPGLDADRLLLAQSLGGEPLFLAMSGLVAAKQGVDVALRLRADALALRLAEDELERIGRFWRAGGQPAAGDPPLHARLAAAATAVQGISGQQAARALCAAEAEAAGITLPGGPEPARAALHAALAAPDGGIGGIEPDILGEAAMILTWGAGAEGLAALRRLATTHRAAVTQVVVRACQDFLIRGERRPMAWLEALREDIDDLEALLALANAMPAETLELRETALALSTHAVETARGAAAGEARGALLSMALNDLSNRLSDLGQREAALAAIEEAVAIRRTLAAAEPDAFLPHLARSLNNLSNRLSDLGRREAALAAIEEGVALCRTLAEARPDTFLSILAVSLNHLSNQLSDLGRLKAARAAVEEAVATYRTLAAAQPNVFLPNLATSLNNLSNHLAELGQREASLAAIEEAVANYRTLAAARPDAFLPSLAMTLNTLSNGLSAARRQEAALAASQEAVAIRRDLAATRPDAFLPKLAGSLNNLSRCLSELGRREAALAASEEAVAILRNLAAAQPDAFLPDLAGSLSNLSVHVASVGRREAALAAIEEAVAVRRTLAASRPDAFLPGLALSLHNLAHYLFALDRREAALAASEEAVTIRRRLAAAEPDAFLPDLATSLGARGQVLRDADSAAAADCFAEGIAALRAPFLRLPQAFASLMGALRDAYIAACEAAGCKPDMDLLAPIIAALQQPCGPEDQDGHEQAG